MIRSCTPLRSGCCNRQDLLRRYEMEQGLPASVLVWGTLGRRGRSNVTPAPGPWLANTGKSGMIQKSQKRETFIPWLDALVDAGSGAVLSISTSRSSKIPCRLLWGLMVLAFIVCHNAGVMCMKKQVDMNLVSSSRAMVDRFAEENHGRSISPYQRKIETSPYVAKRHFGLSSLSTPMSLHADAHVLHRITQ